MRLALLALLVLAGCGTPDARSPKAPPDVSGAFKTYMEAVDGHAKRLNRSGSDPDDVADAALAAADREGQLYRMKVREYYIASSFTIEGRYHAQRAAEDDYMRARREMRDMAKLRIVEMRAAEAQAAK